MATLIFAGGWNTLKLARCIGEHLAVKRYHWTNMPEIANVRYTHEAIAEWLVANPMGSQNECAQFFGYSAVWISTIINSDAFQVYYRKLADERGAIAVHGIGEKINALAAMALDKAMERLQVSPSDQFVLDTTETALKALGYLGNNGNGHQAEPAQHMHIHVDAEMLVEAREAAARRFTPALVVAPVSATP
jgi:hypothetical protein